MLRLTKLIARTLSLRLSLTVLGALAFLLMAALLIMFSFSRKAVKEEALQKAEQTLEATVQHIDNILLSVEQAVGNIYWKMLSHLDQPEKRDEYCRKLAETNPYVVDCRIIMDSDSDAIDINAICWTDTLIKDRKDDDATISFCLPFYVDGKKSGVLIADVSLIFLSKIALETKPSPNSYCTLLGNDGDIIVFPDSSKLNHSVYTLADQDPAIKETARAMMAGESGYKHVEVDDEDYYVFYKPFERNAVPGRSVEKMGWSAAIIYPENDIFGDYNSLLYMVLVISVVGLVLLLLLCQTYIHRQLFPLRLLSKSAQRISEGCYDESIPDTRQQDEVGRLQKHFQQMQHSLATHVGEMQQLSATLQERGEVLQAAYEQAQAAEHMKTSFLYNMSNQIMAPVNTIYSNVLTISKSYGDLNDEETNRLVDEIQLRGEKITELLNQLIADSEKIKK